jgi:hypothetical protein
MAELEDVRAKLLEAIDQKLSVRPAASKTIMELAHAYEALSRSSDSASRSS